MLEPSGHTEIQPGLRGHSWNPDDDLLKRFCVKRSRSTSTDDGWLVVKSFDRFEDAISYAERQSLTDAGKHYYRVEAQW